MNQRITNVISTMSRISTSKLNAVTIILGLWLTVVGCASTKPQIITYRGAPQNVKEFMVDGLQVILRPTDPSNHVISAKLFIKGGVAALPPGVSPAVEQLALQVPPLSGPGGPAGMSKEEYSRLLYRMFSGIVPGLDRDYSTMTLRCADEQFDRSWELFTGVILHPQFDAAELQNAKDRLILGLRNRLNNPSSYADYLVNSAYFHNHPYGRSAREEDVPGLDAKTLLDYYRTLFVKSRLLLVVVGNIDSADIHARIAKSLAKLPVGAYKPPVVPVPENADSSILIVRPPYGGSKAVTSYVVARYLAPNRGDSLYFPMMRLTSFLFRTPFP